MKRLAILGSTGSIGTSTLKIIKQYPEKFQVKALAAKQNIDLLEQQANEFHPELIAVYDKDKALELQKRLPHINVVGGMEGLQEAAAHNDVDFVVSAMTGTLGLIPTVTAIKARKKIGLANKEALVSGGSLVMSLAKENGVQLLPIDSEHSAIFQCLQGQQHSAINRLIITASGGPFRLHTDEELNKVTVECSLKHPSWMMGPKITIDCSTLMNKGLEVIEAHWLFGIPIDKIDVIVHPQSIIHSMVEFCDHGLLAQMGQPDMIVPIQYALTYPERYPINSLKPFDFLKNGTLQFFLPDTKKFRCLQLAFDSVRTGGSMPCYMNAANEVLVERFMKRNIGWKEIGTLLETLMSRHSVQKIRSLEDVLAVDALARAESAKIH